MDKIFAKDLMSKLYELDRAMNAVAVKIEELDDMSEKLQFREGVFDLIADSYSNLTNPIIIQHAEIRIEFESRMYQKSMGNSTLE